METFEAWKKLLVDTAQDLTRKGYLMATGGNLSVRIPGSAAFAITPSNYDYLKMIPNDICVLDFDLSPLEGQRKPSVEAGMHAAIYRVRPDVNAVIHTHQVYTSALTLIPKPIPALFDEQVLFLGPSVEIIPYAPSGTDQLRDTVAAHVQNHSNAFLMQNHGALVFGHDMERAVHNVEVLEKCSLAYLLALCSGETVSEIPPAARELAYRKLCQDQAKMARPTEGLHDGGEFVIE